MGKFISGLIVMGIAVIWYFGLPGALFVIGASLALWGMGEHQLGKG